MAVSKERTDWGLLLLRLGVGGFAILQGMGPILHARHAWTMANALHLGLALLEVIGGAFVLLGLWTTPMTLALAALVAWPLVQGWMHGARPLGEPYALFRLVATLAACIAGPGKGALSK